MDKNLVLTKAKNAEIARDFTTAVRSYKELLRGEPSNMEYLSAIGRIYVKAGEDAKAIPFYQQIIELDPHSISAMNSMGAIFRRLKRYDESITVLKRALSENKDTASVNYNLGFTYKEMGNNEEAIDCFEMVVEENPEDVLAFNHLGSIYSSQNDYQRAILSYKRGLQIDQNHPILNYNIARCYEETQQYPDAIRSYELALRTKPGWTEAIHSFSNLLLRCQKTKEAQVLVQRSMKLYPNDVKMLCLLGNIFLTQFDFDAAEKTFKKAKNLNPKSVDALSGLALALEKSEKMQEALETIEKALDIEPDNLKLKKQEAGTLLSAKDYEEAFQKIDTLYKSNGENDPQILDLYGQYYVCMDDAKSAEQYFEKIKKIDKHYKKHLLSAANRSQQIGKTEDAEKYAKQYIERRGNDPDGYNTLGKIYSKSGQLNEAITTYQQGLKLNKENIYAGEQIEKLKKALSETEIEQKLNEEADNNLEEISVEEIEIDEPVNDDFDFNSLGTNDEKSDEPSGMEELPDSFGMEPLMEDESGDFDFSEYDEPGKDKNNLDNLAEPEEDLFGDSSENQEELKKTETPKKEPLPSKAPEMEKMPDPLEPLEEMDADGLDNLSEEPAEDNEKIAETENTADSGFEPEFADENDTLENDSLGNDENGLSDLSADEDDGIDDIFDSGLADGNTDNSSFEEPDMSDNDVFSSEPEYEEANVPSKNQESPYQQKQQPQPVSNGLSPELERQIQEQAMRSAGMAMEAANNAQRMAQRFANERSDFEEMKRSIERNQERLQDELREQKEKNEQLQKEMLQKQQELEERTKALEESPKFNKVEEEPLGEEPIEEPVEETVEEPVFEEEPLVEEPVVEEETAEESELEETELEEEPVSEEISLDEQTVSDETIPENIIPDEPIIPVSEQEQEGDKTLSSQQFFYLVNDNIMPDTDEFEDNSNVPDTQDLINEIVIGEYEFPTVETIISDILLNLPEKEDAEESELNDDLNNSEQEEQDEQPKQPVDEQTKIQNELPEESRLSTEQMLYLVDDDITLNESGYKENDFENEMTESEMYSRLSSEECDFETVDSIFDEKAEQEVEQEAEQKTEQPQNEAETESQPSEESTEKNTEIENLIQRIEKMLSDESIAKEYKAEIEMFKKLKMLLEYLPEEARAEIDTEKLRMQIEYIISRISGRPGLCKTIISLIKSGALGEEYAKREIVSEREDGSLDAVISVITTMKNLTQNLKDTGIANSLNEYADEVLKKIYD